MHRRLAIAVVPVFVTLGTACTSVKSADLETAGMSAHITVTADGQGNTRASAELNVDNNATDFVDLSPGDSLVATPAGGSSQTMTRGDVLGIISYSTGFNGQDAPGTAYTIAFNRKAPAVSAPSSTCSIPQPFSVSSPASGVTFSRATDAITVNWAAAGQSDAMSYVISGSCVKTATGTIPADSGSFTIPKGTLVVSGGSSSCTATLTVNRTRSGQVDQAFGYGGGISCIQARSVTFVSAP
jgi:hypothetical protein